MDQLDIPTEYNQLSCSSELGWLHLCNTTQLKIHKSMGGRGCVV